ncbi:endo alpha-1,4 polygalactosaminidase [Butyrivibrio proteoclasticus]|uniref:endo alpha-1,4 polygalactosaminidase n=1 Tax=Butyrivibrio proteoclasticus TaxID=43305 RepID=UPI00047E99F6|nr:endo alpha-1,4 polygalactosaminidase [Butyrivibrio proteoclasticus]
MKKATSIILTAMLIFTTGCSLFSPYDQEYGVYLSDDFDDLDKELNCKTIVIDAQYYTKAEIAQIHEKNGTVLSYVNVGSLENFRDYFEDFEDLTLAPYEHWEGEYWIDVSEKRWQDFLVEEVGQSLKDKGVDGFFIDNTDVYYVFHEDKIYEGLVSIMKRLKAMDMKVIINGGDNFVSRCIDENGTIKGVLDGVNQESVFTTIDWDNDSFRENDEEETEYFLAYLKKVKKAGGEVYVLEYSQDQDITKKAIKKCHKLGYTVYVSDSLELTSQ